MYDVNNLFNMQSLTHRVNEEGEFWRGWKNGNFDCSVNFWMDQNKAKIEPVFHVVVRHGFHGVKEMKVQGLRNAKRALKAMARR